jgi:AraC-like DNA-binding protein
MLREVRFRHEPSGPLEEYESFFGARVHFRQTETCLVCDPAVLDLRNGAADPDVLPYLAPRAAAMMDDLEPSSDRGVADRVRRVIEIGLREADASQAGAARRLGTSVRSLQRSLHDSGATFRDLLDDVREAACRRLLGDRSLSVYEISFLLGFTDTSSFHRAFRRWTGKTPTELRDGLPA